MSYAEIVRLVVLDNPLSDWAIAACVGILTFATLLSVRAYLIRALKDFKKTPTVIDDVGMALVARVRLTYLLLASLFAGGAIVLTFTPAEHQVFLVIIMVATLIQIGFCAQGVIDVFLKPPPNPDMAASHRYMASGMLASARIVVWFTVLMLGLDTMGFNVMAAVTTFGIGGIAVALAVQGLLKDVFASFAILLDQPFTVGDFITFDDKGGIVEHIGIKTTRLRTMAGEELVLNNADLLQSRIHNHRRTGERQVTMSLAIRYEVPTDVLRSLPDNIGKTIEQHEKAHFKSATYGEYAREGLMLDVIYRVDETRYSSFAKVRHTVNLNIHELLMKLDVPFGYTTQRTVVENGRTHRPRKLSDTG